MWVTRIAEGREIADGEAISSLEAAPGDELHLRYSYEVPGKTPTVVLSQLHRKSLRPIAEIHDYGEGDTVIVHYGSFSVQAERRTRGQSQWYAPVGAEGTPFSAASLDLVFRALPLHIGFESEVPAYFFI
jgi:hypothetical protein